MKIIACNSNIILAEAISSYIGVSLAKASLKRFADREIFVEINENIRGEDVFIIQSTSHPANDHLMELLITIDAAKRGSAQRITAVIPYYGYARQDRKTGPRTPITAKLVANLITSAGADRVLTMDLHAGQIQGFFDIPLDNIFSAPPIIKDMKEKFIIKNCKYNKFFTAKNRNKDLFDLRGMINYQFIELGVNNLHNIKKDTYSNDSKFYSHRRSTINKEYTVGRMINIIGFK